MAGEPEVLVDSKLDCFSAFGSTVDTRVATLNNCSWISPTNDEYEKLKIEYEDLKKNVDRCNKMESFRLNDFLDKLLVDLENNNIDGAKNRTLNYLIGLDYGKD